MSSAVYLLSGGTVVTALAKPIVIADGAVAIRDGRIEAVGPQLEMTRRYPDARSLDARGGLILPGLVNLHHHFYSSLARGLAPGRPLATFPEILEGLWWRLDRALDREGVEISAELALADCIRCGCTTVFDHHASPSFVSGSLDVIAGAVEAAGLRAKLCYEISDRNGHDEAMAAIEENFAFAASRHDHPRVRGMIGLHASFTLSDASLQEVEKRDPGAFGIHVHMVEDQVDITASLERYRQRPLDRLVARGLVNDRSILVHGVHLEAQELEIVAEKKATLVHNPESNLNNGVGRLALEDPRVGECRLALGTDGMSSSMLGSLRAAFLGLRGGARNPTLGFEVIPDLLARNAEIAAFHFDEEGLGRLEQGAPADVAVLSYVPPTPVDESNVFGHLVYAAREYPVRHTIAAGRVLMEDFRMTTIDPQTLGSRAQSIARQTWERFGKL